MQGILTFNIQIEFWFGLMLLCLAYFFFKGEIDVQWKINIWFIEIILKKGTCVNIFLNLLQILYRKNMYRLFNKKKLKPVFEVEEEKNIKFGFL